MASVTEHFGEDLEVQAKKQGYTLGKEYESVQACKNAIVTLNFGLDLPDSVHKNLLGRLRKIVDESLKLLKEDDGG